jgi:TetR/AcrR family transcriptional regulator, transcriptional repressor for nem operon
MGKPQPDTKERLIEAATELIFKRGYANVGVQELCERAGVKKGSFYHFFPSKRDLTLAALEARWGSYRVGIEGCIAAPMPAFQRVQLLFNSLYMQYQTAASGGETITGCPFGTLSMEVSAHDSVLREALQKVFTEWAQLFSVFFAESVRAGELPANTNANLAGEALLAYLEGVLLMVKTGQNPRLLIQLQPTLAQFQAFGALEMK